MTLHSETKRIRREEQLLERFSQEYTDFQYETVNFLADHLRDLSKSFGGDLQQVMILALLGQRRLGALRAGKTIAEPQPEDMAMTATRLADCIGIPRETVRRKLVLLRDRGWIAQSEDGSWLIRSESAGEEVKVRKDLAALDLRGRQRVARLVAALESI